MFIDFISQLAFNDVVTLIVTVITIGGIGFTIVWNTSKKFQKIQSDYEKGEENHNKDISVLKEQIQELKDSRAALLLEYNQKMQEIDKASIKREADTKIERKEEITKELSNQQTKFEALQRQIDSVRGDVKVVASTVTEVDTKVEYLEKQTEKTETRLNCEIDYQRRKDMLRDIPKAMADKLENP